MWICLLFVCFVVCFVWFVVCLGPQREKECGIAVTLLLSTAQVSAKVYVVPCNGGPNFMIFGGFLDFQFFLEILPWGATGGRSRLVAIYLQVDLCVGGTVAIDW